MTENVQDIEPTEEEKRNGWTKETLSEYINERLSQPFGDGKEPVERISNYDPLRW